MNKSIISLSGIGELFHVYPVKRRLRRDWGINNDSKWFVEKGKCHEICLLQEDIYCTATYTDGIINPKVEPLENLLSELYHASPSDVLIYHVGRAYSSQQFVVEMNRPWHYFNPDLIDLVQVDFKRAFGKGVASTRVLYDGEPVTKVRAKYSLMLDKHNNPKGFSEPFVDYLFNDWDGNIVSTNINDENNHEFY